MHAFADIAFTDAVKAEQVARGSRAAYARREGGGETTADRLGPQEVEFIAMRDSVYMATVSETGWPYIQHRGGDAGFIRAVDEKTLEFPDYAGNRQYISVGNLAGNDRVALFLMDYPNRTRLKLLGRAEIVDVEPVGGKPRVERLIRIHVDGFDWNCPQFITPRYTLPDIERAVAPLRARIAELEAALASGDGASG